MKLLRTTFSSFLEQKKVLALMISQQLYGWTLFLNFEMKVRTATGSNSSSRKLATTPKYRTDTTQLTVKPPA